MSRFLCLVVSLRALLLILPCLHLVNAARNPRVALLFATRGPMPLESVWRTMLEGVAQYRIPKLTNADWQNVLETDRIKDVQHRLRTAGQLAASDRIQHADCVSNTLIRVRICGPLLLAHFVMNINCALWCTSGTGSPHMNTPGSHWQCTHHNYIQRAPM